jgi:protein TonB
MASPEELTPLLPETLPDDFGDWDSEASSASSLPVNSDEWEAWAAAHPFTENPKPDGKSPDHDQTRASSVDTPRVSGSASSAPEPAKQEVVFSYGESETSPKSKPVSSREEWEAWIESRSFSETPKPFGQSAERKAISSPVREAGLSTLEKPSASASAVATQVLVKEPELTVKPVNGSAPSAVRAPEASRTPIEAPIMQVSPAAATVDGIANLPKPAAASKREADEALFQWYSSKDIEVKAEEKTAQQKTAKKKWIAIGAASAVSILLLLMIPLFYHGSKSAAKPSVQQAPVATDSQQGPQSPDATPSEPSTQNQPPAATEKQPAAASQPANQPANQQGGANPAKAPTKQQAKVMDDQLTAPTLIPQSQVAENAPPQVNFGAAGADGLGGSSSNAGVLTGHAQPVVRVAPTKPFTISSGVAAGMLIQKTPPIYPSIAKAARVAGTVELRATIAKNGTIKDLHIVNGPAMLQQAAVDAVRTWRYKPYKLNNDPVEVETTIKLVFSLAG